MGPVNSTSSPTNDTSQQNCDFTDSTAAKIFKLMALSIVLLISLVGNALIIIVVYKTKELRKTINYFIVNMAISDLALPLAIIPSSLAWMVGDSNYKRSLFIGETLALVVCKCVYFLNNLTVLVSVQSLIWIAIDRFVAVVFPMKFRFISSKFCAKAIISTWIFSVAVVVPSMLPQKLVKYKPTAQCGNRSPLSTVNETAGITYDTIYFSTFLILALLVITILYSAIAVVLNRKGRNFVNSSANIQRQNERKKRAAKMSFCIVAALSICYLPALLSNLFAMFGRKMVISCWYIVYIGTFLFIANVIFLASSTVNPIICFIFVGRYRRGIKHVLASFCTKSLNLKREIVHPDQITLKNIKKTGEKEIRPSTLKYA